MMIKLYREMKDYGVSMESYPGLIHDVVNFVFIKDDVNRLVHVADFETMENDPELVETILISELHDFLHRYFGIE